MFGDIVFYSASILSVLALCLAVYEGIITFAFDLDKYTIAFVFVVKSYYNEMFHCSKCENYSRKYQLELDELISGNVTRCPHCKSSNHYLKKVEEQYDWMKTTPEAPALSVIGAKKMQMTMDITEKKIKEIRSIKAFEKHNKLEVNARWVEDLIQDLEKYKQM